MDRTRGRRFTLIAAAVLVVVVLAFLLVALMWGIAGPSPSETGSTEMGSTGTLLTGGVVGAIVGLVGVFVAQFLAGKRHSEALLHARELEAQRAGEAALQNYFEQMGELITDPERPLHRATPGDNLSTVARAQTLSILEGLEDPVRKRILLQFLYESGVISKDKPVISVAGANLVEANLARAFLAGAKLAGVNLARANLKRANLGEANLEGAFMDEANLEGANLEGANLAGARLGWAKLEWAKLQGANLKEANLGGAILEATYLQTANLAEAFLYEVNLTWAKLTRANLTGANLEGANLEGAYVAKEELDKAFLEEAIMPDGSKHS